MSRRLQPFRFWTRAIFQSGESQTTCYEASKSAPTRFRPLFQGCSTFVNLDAHCFSNFCIQCLERDYSSPSSRNATLGSSDEHPQVAPLSIRRFSRWSCAAVLEFDGFWNRLPLVHINGRIVIILVDPLSTLSKLRRLDKNETLSLTRSAGPPGHRLLAALPACFDGAVLGDSEPGDLTNDGKLRPVV